MPPTFRSVADLLDRIARGDVVLIEREECGTCGGEGVVDPTHGLTVSEYGRLPDDLADRWAECPSCGGSGKVWPKWVVYTIAQEMTQRGAPPMERAARQAATTLDALAAADREEQSDEPTSTTNPEPITTELVDGEQSDE